jgi:xanthine dehydrogenase accessory factor
MSAWQEAVASLRLERTPAVLVSVDSIVGSTPREAGARMIVTADDLYGTIGGGNLEYQACRIARDQLELGAEDGVQRFPLGAGLGQCCGGLVNLMFERLGTWNR